MHLFPENRRRAAIAFILVAAALDIVAMGIISPSVGPQALLPHPGAALFLAALVLLLAAVIGWAVARRAEQSEPTRVA